jgi:hypothetical protein
MNTYQKFFMAEDYVLTDTEYQSVTDWLTVEKDHLSGNLKEGLLKLLNGEMHRRIAARRLKSEGHERTANS